MPSAAVRQVSTADLIPAEVATIRDLLWSAFPPGDEGMTEADWEHALGGQHFLLQLDGALVAHASVVERELRIADRSVRTGYVEAVATDPGRQGRGHGTQVIQAVNDYIAAHFELGALGTGSQRFYERLGWRTWRGPTFVRTADGPRRTPDEDGFILVLTTPTSPVLDFEAPLSCDDRPGDVW